MGEVCNDTRCAVIVKGAPSDLTATNVEFKNLGCYVWEDSDANFQGCKFEHGLHGIYAWGNCKVAVTNCTINDMEKSGICIRDGATLQMRVSNLQTVYFTCGQHLGIR
jgi:hypothetical protein